MAAVKTLYGWKEANSNTEERLYWSDYCPAGSEISDEVYQHFLEILPPHKREPNGFLVGEPTDHTPRGTTWGAYVYRPGQERYYYLGDLTEAEFYQALSLNNVLNEGEEK